GFEYESNYQKNEIARENHAVSTYVWQNAGENNDYTLFVKQIGSNLHFYNITNATVTTPLSTKKLATVIDLTTYETVADCEELECQYAYGRGLLYVFHPRLDTIYCE